MMSNAESDIYLLKHMNELSQFLVEQKQISQAADVSKVLEPKFLKQVTV